MRSILPALIGVTVLQGAARAGEEPPGHACRAAPNAAVAALPAPQLMDGIGTSAMKVTTASAKAQRYFDQGLNLLHCFWDTEAYLAFREAARLDPACAMAFWGIFTALGQNARETSAERAAALARAVELAGTASDRERHYIRAAALLADPAKGRAAWIAEMEALIDRYPEDVEAKLLLANMLSTPVSSYAPDGRPREGKLYGQAILSNLLVTHPNHAAVHHYWIHAVENGPRPRDALASARKLPLLAPNSGHMLHMPGHIYYRLGDYARARRSFLASMRRDEAYMRERGVGPVNTWNYVHNLDYLVATCAEDGRYAEGARWARLLGEIRRDDSRLDASGQGYLLYGGHTALARLQIRYGMWDEAVRTLSIESTGRANDHPLERDADGSLAAAYRSGVLLYAKGMAAAERGDLDACAAQEAALEAHLASLANETASRGSDWYFRHASRVLAVHLAELRGVALSRRGEHGRAAEVLTEATERERDLGYWEPPHYARPVLESLGEAHARAGRFDLAADAYRRALERRPGSGHALAGLARSLERAGKRAEAARVHRQFHAAWRGADPDVLRAVGRRTADGGR
jgi:tetratricopeptide (TPR) repeat protein